MSGLKQGDALILLLTATMVFSSTKLQTYDNEQLPSNDMVRREILNENPSSCQGLPGRDGRDGRDATLRGVPGKPGVPGPPGPTGAPGKAPSTGGVVYTRWGRTQCPAASNTVMLYSGVMGGSYHNSAGGASNYLCLPLNPIFEKYIPGVQASTFIHGTEYQIHGDQKKIFPNADLHDDNAPCAVCHAKSRGSHVMIPARNVCPSGWTMEYKGYLMAANEVHRGRSEYICVDGNPEATHGSHVNKDGALLYFVESHCAHELPCPPYVHGRELTCVVCTQ